VLDEQWVERDPVPRVDRPGELALGLLGSSGPHDAESVRDPVDVRVDRDRGYPVPEHEHAVRRFGTDPVQGRQLVERAGDLPAEPVEEVAGHNPDHPSLRVVESRPPDERLDRGGRGAGEGRRVRVSREQERARHVGRLVPGALRKDRPDQDLERVFRVVPEVGGPPVPRPVERREPVEQRFPVEVRVGHGDARRRAEGRAVASGGGGLAAPGVTPGSDRSGSSPVPDGRCSSPMR